MTLTEAYEKLKGLEIFEERSVTDELVDVVFENRHAASWHERMAAVLGPALKPPGAGSNRRANQLAKSFGGIRSEQSLYYQAFGDHAVMAMFWPWGNGRCTSCKIFRVAVLPPEQGSSLFSRWFKK